VYVKRNYPLLCFVITTNIIIILEYDKNFLKNIFSVVHMHLLLSSSAVGTFSLLAKPPLDTSCMERVETSCKHGSVDRDFLETYGAIKFQCRNRFLGIVVNQYDDFAALFPLFASSFVVSDFMAMSTLIAFPLRRLRRLFSMNRSRVDSKVFIHVMDKRFRQYFVDI
jgi:hypothetical protein